MILEYSNLWRERMNPDSSILQIFNQRCRKVNKSIIFNQFSNKECH